MSPAAAAASGVSRVIGVWQHLHRCCSLAMCGGVCECGRITGITRYTSERNRTRTDIQQTHTKKAERSRTRPPLVTLPLAVYSFDGSVSVKLANSNSLTERAACSSCAHNKKRTHMECQWYCTFTQIILRNNNPKDVRCVVMPTMRLMSCTCAVCGHRLTHLTL